MIKYELWDKKSKINGLDASHFLNQFPFKNYNGDIILIYSEMGNINNVECKDILASICNIDKDLPLDTFMKKYFAYENKINSNNSTNDN